MSAFLVCLSESSFLQIKEDEIMKLSDSKTQFSETR